MILRNWMERDPITVESGTLVADAIALLLENNLRALPVIDQGELRGLVTRKELQGCATAVARAQSEYETEYFLNRLKIRDIMTRMPKTVEAGDSVEYCMLKGQDDLIRNYPVMENGKLVGMVSSLELFSALSSILGANEVWCGITLEALPLESGTISKVSKLVEDTGAILHGVFTMRLPNVTDKRIILRFDGGTDVGVVAKALEQGGYKIFEKTDAVQTCGHAA
ncbi:CBS domain-containing protein [Desulfoferula mesophila]|uniref:CBS domain-containing protein n=1 Tax=Desulfoferula mesophila TaxID=3058419 RepID=A0AAU9EAC5_9BACT|nr:CBS domain-containing protein [Desulfoferula mesophilus]